MSCCKGSTHPDLSVWEGGTGVERVGGERLLWQSMAGVTIQSTGTVFSSQSCFWLHSSLLLSRSVLSNILRVAVSCD